MAEKFDRTNLKRKVQRLESYTTLVSKKRVAIFNNHNTTTKKKYSSSEIIKLGQIKCEGDCRENEDVKNKEINGNAVLLLSPSSTGTGSGSSSTDESLEFMPAYQSFHKSVIKSNQSEYEATSVMTRSASRKYATVGAIHNKVNVEKEPMRTKHWPVNISYPIPGPEKEIELLKNTVSEAFFQVMTFCKLAKDPAFLSKKCSQEKTVCIPNETLTSLDLPLYSTHEQIVIDGNQNQMSLQLQEKWVPCQIIDTIPLYEEEPDVSKYKQDIGAYRSINITPESSLMFNTLKSKFFTKTCPSYVSCDTTIIVDSSRDNNLAIAVHNDHSYALRYNEEDKLNEPSILNYPLSEFKLNEALNNLMLNTAVLKCLVCGEFPQDIASYLNKY